MPLPDIIKPIMLHYSGDMLPEFLGVELDSVSDTGRFGNQLIHVACRRGELEYVSLLLQAGADVNAMGETGYRPIHCAIAGGHRGITGLLLAAGADPMLFTDLGYDARSLAELYTNNDAMAALKLHQT